MSLCTYHTSSGLALTSKLYSSDSLPSLHRTAVRLATQASRLSNGMYCVGACLITRRPTTFCTGFCTDRTHPLQKKFIGDNPKKLSLHAEIDALSKLKNFSGDLECMVVVRTLKVRQTLATSRPCDICMGGMMSFNVRSILYYEHECWHLVEL